MSEMETLDHALGIREEIRTMIAERFKDRLGFIDSGFCADSADIIARIDDHDFAIQIHMPRAVASNVVTMPQYGRVVQDGTAPDEPSAG